MVLDVFVFEFLFCTLLCDKFIIQKLIKKKKNQEKKLCFKNLVSKSYYLTIIGLVCVEYQLKGRILLLFYR